MLDNVTSYVAIGDSFSEGLMDPDVDGVDNRFRGWTDRLAELLVDSPIGGAELRYANLAIRGRILHQIIDEQVPKVLDIKPDMVTFCAGGNDCLRPKADVDELANQFERAVIAMRGEGIHVVMCNGFDTEISSPLIRSVRPRVGMYNSHLWTIAQRHGCDMVDLWGLRPLYRPENWAADRIHLTSAGHEMVAQQALTVLESGRSMQSQGFAMPTIPPRPIRDAVAEESRWAREFLVPWVGRRLRGESSGDRVSPKRPDLGLVVPGAHLASPEDSTSPEGHGAASDTAVPTLPEGPASSEERDLASEAASGSVSPEDRRTTSSTAPGSVSFEERNAKSPSPERDHHA